MSTVIPLSDRYATLLSGIDDPDEEWMQMVMDHKENIKDNSNYVDITPDVLNSYRYRPGDYLYEVWHISRSYIWIFKYINDLTTVVDFDIPLTGVYVPSVQYITELRSTYKAKQAMITKAVSAVS